MWGPKFAICIAYDFFDFTIGRVMFLIPFSGEIIGCLICARLFGWQGVIYGFEVLDPTEQLDGFLPLATIIAIANRPSEVERREQEDAARRSDPSLKG